MKLFVPFFVAKECYSLENQIDVNKLLSMKPHSLPHRRTAAFMCTLPFPPAHMQTFIRVSVDILTHSLLSIYANEELTDFLTATITVSTSTSFVLYGFLHPFIFLAFFVFCFQSSTHFICCIQKSPGTFRLRSVHSAHIRYIPAVFNVQLAS